MVFNQILIAKIQSYWLKKGFMMNISYYSKERKLFKRQRKVKMSKVKNINLIG